MAFDHSKFIARFVDEAREHCSRISEGLLNLENTPGDTETVNGLFRSAHTIKGSSRMMKLSGVTELAHKMEDVLDAVRGGKISLTSSVSDALFRGVDALMAMLEKITAGDKSVDAPETLCEELAKAAEGVTETSEETPTQPEAPKKTDPEIHAKQQQPEVPVQAAAVIAPSQPVEPEHHLTPAV